MTRDPAQTRCPVCDRRDAELLWSVDADEVTRMALVAERDPDRADALRDHVERLWDGSECRMLRCRQCGFEFADPFRAGDARFYDLIYEGFDYAGHEWDWHLTRDRLLELTRASSRSETTLLEIGAGSGGFLREVVPGLFDPAQVVCTEFNPEAAGRLQAMGVDAIDRDFRELQGADFAGRFSFVCMFHVLEHLDGIDRVFECLTRLTRDDAHVFISLPNPINAAFYESHGVFVEWPPHHIGRWHRRAFEILGERFGWEVVDHRVEPVSPARLLRNLAADRLIQRSRTAGSLSRRARLISDRRLRLAACAPLLAVEVLRALPVLRKARPRDLGRSHWVELRRSVTNRATPSA